VLASTPDLLRLLAVPFFGYVAYRDIQTRRVPNRTWYPIAALAVVLLVWDVLALFAGGAAGLERRRFLVGVAVSLLLVVPLVYGFWLIGGFGGADAKAFFVVAVLFPVFPSYELWQLGVGLGWSLPVVRPALPVFSLTVLTNTVLVGAAYPVALGARNAFRGSLSPAMFVGKPVAARAVDREYGTLLALPERGLTEDRSLAGLRSYLSWRGLDLDALRMYLQWRGCALADLRAEPERHRDPASLPAEPGDPGDGAITDGDRGSGDREMGTGAARTESEATGEGSPAAAAADAESAGDEIEDPWGAAAFLEDIEGSAYGTTPEQLRAGLDRLVAAETVWISPGIPFLVPLFVGLVVSLVAGDLLYAALGLTGLVPA
jgi:preflagellin peptidase FlaK